MRLLEQEIAGRIRKGSEEFRPYGLCFIAIAAEIKLQPVARHGHFRFIQPTVAFHKVHDRTVGDKILCMDITGIEQQER